MSTSKSDLSEARAAKEEAKRLLSSRPGVVGVGITGNGEDGFAVQVNVDCSPATADLPLQVAGVPVVPRVVGQVRKQSA